MSYGNLSLGEMAEEVHAVNQANGWFEEDRTFGDDIALITTEVGEAYDAFRLHGLADVTASASIPVYSDEEDHMGNYRQTGWQPAKPEGVGSELADIFIRLLDTAFRRGINLNFEYRRKLDYNKTRGYKHGGKAI